MYSPRTWRWLALALVVTVDVAAAAATAQIDGEKLADTIRPGGARVSEQPSAQAPQAGQSRGLPVASDFSVSFIRAGGDNPVAVVNGETVGVGDTVGGAEVTAIERGRVRLLLNGSEAVVSAWADGVRQPVQQPVNE